MRASPRPEGYLAVRTEFAGRRRYALVALGRTQEESAAAAQANGTFGFGGEASDLLINEALNSTVNGRCKSFLERAASRLTRRG